MPTAALQEFLELLPNAFHRIGACGDILHAPIGLGSGMRGLLLSLDRVGPSSVSRLAAMRPVSRQFVQRLVDEMVVGGWVEARPNPHHKRSPLITITVKGRDAIARMQHTEAPYLLTLSDGLDPDDVAAATRIIRAICDRVTPDVLEQLAQGSDIVAVLEAADA